MTISVTEAAVMFLLPLFLPADVSGWVEALSDALLLTILCTPVLWIFVFRPLRQLAAVEKGRVDAIVNTAADPIITISGAGLIKSFNPAAERLFGYSEIEVLEKNVRLLMPSPFREEHDGYLARYRMTGKKNIIGIGREVTGQRKDGTVLPIHLAVGEVIDDSQGVRFTGILRDLSAQKQREEELLRLNRKAHELSAFGNILEQSLNEIYIFDAETLHFVRVNRGVQDNLGYTVEELHGMTAIDIKPEYTPASFAKMIAPLVEGTQDSLEYKTVHRRKDGSQYAVEVHLEISVLGEKQVLVAVILDITARLKMEAELRDSRERALAANQAKSEFLANMSHEIRTPMTAILGFTEILLENVTEPENVAAARTVQENGEYLINLINNILDLSKIEAGKIEVEQIDCSPHKIVSDVCSLMRVRASAKDLQLKVDFDRPIPETIQSDPTRLRQILINVLGNAIKFTETGSVKLVTRLLNEPGEKPKLQFDVIDTGIGITEDKLETLFQPFTQADGSMTRQFGGTGLGLTISKRMVELLGGKISISSTVGKGSTFSVTVSTGPLDDVRLIQYAVEAAVETVNTKVADETKVSLHNCRILLAEDGPDNQRLIGFILKKAGAKVTLANNGQIAFDLATAAAEQKLPFDVILMDMQMPVLDGYAATGKLREAEYTAPIIALTAHAMASDRQKCLDVGCDDYTTKPVDRKKLISLVAKYAAATKNGSLGGRRLTSGVPIGGDGRQVTIDRVIDSRVLLAEDVVNNQKLVCRILTRAGATTTVAENGQIAVELAEEAQNSGQPFDVILMDMQMPVLDGYEATRRLRANGYTAPIVALTAHAMSGDREKCLNAGCDEYTTKPIDTKHLIHLVRTHTHRFRATFSNTERKWISTEDVTTADMETEFSTPIEDAPRNKYRFLETETALQRLQGDHELFAFQIQLFLESSPDLLADLERAIAGGEPGTVLIAAHSLKGIVAEFTAKSPFKTAQLLEKQANEGDLSQSEQLLEKLQEGVCFLMEELRDYASGETLNMPSRS